MQIRSINATLTALALVTITLVGCATSPQAKRNKYLARGKTLIQKKDYARAILEFRNAARAMPTDAESYYQIGMAYLATNDLRTGYAALRKAVELNPKHRDAQMRLAQMLAMSGDPALLKDAESRLRLLMEDGTVDAETLNALAFTELRLGNTDSAIRNYEQVLAQYPGELTAAVMLARTKLTKNDRQGAEQILKKACDDAPKSPDARRILAEFYVDQKDDRAGEAELQKALALDAKNGPALLDLGRLQLAKGNKTDAGRIFQMLGSIPGYEQVYGVFLMEQGRNEEAIRELQRVAKIDPDDRTARTRLVAAYRQFGRLNDANAVLAAALKRNPKDADALLQRGEIALEAHKFDEAEADFNRAMKLKPTAPQVHYVIAKLHEARGDKRLYRQELNETLRLNAGLASVRVEIARDLVNQNDGKAALDLLDAAPEPQKNLPTVIAERNWALWVVGDMEKMRRGIDSLLSKGSSSEALIQDGIWKLRAGDRNGARASVEKALDIDPSDVRALEVLKRSYAEKDIGQALQKVTQFAKERPRSAAAQEFLGMMLLGAGKIAGARAALMDAKADDPKTTKVDLSLVQVDLLEKKVDDARNRLKSILAADGGNAIARTWLGNLEVMRGDNDSAIEDFRKAVEVNPLNAQAANNLAYLLIAYRNQTDDGIKYAQKAVELAPDRPAYCDTLGWAYYQKGLYSSAIPYLERAGGSNGDAVWSYHLAMAYAKAGDVARGRKVFAAAMKQNPKVPEAKAAEAVLSGGR